MAPESTGRCTVRAGEAGLAGPRQSGVRGLGCLLACGLEDPGFLLLERKDAHSKANEGVQSEVQTPLCLTASRSAAPE